MVRVYLAGGMFCEGDRMYNAYLADLLRKAVGDKIGLYVPQENASINDKTKCADSSDIFWGDYSRLQQTDILIARIDGDIPPSGTSAEIGIMAQRRRIWDNNFMIFKGKFDYASETFARKHFEQEHGRRPMIIGLCTDSRNPKRTYLEAKNELMKNSDIESQYCYFNLFTVGCIKVNGKLVTSADEMVEAVKEYVKDYEW